MAKNITILSSYSKKTIGGIQIFITNIIKEARKYNDLTIKFASVKIKNNNSEDMLFLNSTFSLREEFSNIKSFNENFNKKIIIFHTPIEHLFISEYNIKLASKNRKVFKERYKNLKRIMFSSSWEKWFLTKEQKKRVEEFFSITIKNFIIAPIPVKCLKTSSNRDKNFVFIGRIHPFKGIHMYLPDIKHKKIVLIGNGKMSNILNACGISSIALKNKKLFYTNNLFLPSFLEVQSTVVIESMLSSRKVALSDTRYNRSAFQGLKIAWFNPLKDDLKDVSRKINKIKKNDLIRNKNLCLKKYSFNNFFKMLKNI